MDSDLRDTSAWAGIEPHLDRALDLDPAARSRWLADLHTTQPQIARAVAALLAEHESLAQAGFLEDSSQMLPGGITPVLNELLGLHAGNTAGARLGPAAGDIVGPYRLIREIGQGGMSSVWLAGRSDMQLKREIALKLPELGPRRLVGHFARERDILAALTHPNIARLYDAGVSSTGQPYLAMEYVAGTALVRSCDEQRLTNRERLRLFLEVLRAMQFAHAELVIHRDLKPSNVLVTASGRVVLLDFGVAKLLGDATASEDTALTQISGRALTPDYASPEQIANQPLGTASDIYSLGVILYELLTGSSPYRPKRDTRAALEESILNDEVRRPSQIDIGADAAAARGASARTLIRALKGDLDTIVLKALRKNPLDRYASVTAFAQDISNHLQSLPVSARPDSNWYRFGRFVSRHKMPVVAATVATLALVGGSIVSLWQARHAAIERDRAIAFASRNEAVSEFLGRVITEAAESGKPVTVSEMLARSEKLALGDTSGSPENRAAVLGMIAERYWTSDESERALPLLKRALTLLASSKDQALRSRLACRYAAADADLDRAEVAIRAIRQEIGRAEADPESISACLLDLSTIYAAAHRGEEALRSAQEGLALVRGVPEAGVREAALLNAVAFGYHLTGRNVEAERYFEQSMRKYGELGRENTDGAIVAMNGWAVMTQGAGMPRPALELFEKAERIAREREAGAEPSTTIVGNRALALLTLGRFAQAREAFDLECRLAVERKDVFSEIHCLIERAAVLVQTGELNLAAADLDRARKLLGDSAPPDSPPMLTYAVWQGRLALAQGHLAEARAQFTRVLASGVAGPTMQYATLGEAEAELAGNAPTEAAEHARLALRGAAAMQGDLPYSYYNGLASLVLGRALLALGDRRQAGDALSAAVRQLSMTVDADHPALLQARQLLKSP